MPIVYQLLTLAPAPLFFLGLLWSIFVGDHHGYEMITMWSIMFLAHLSPWLLWWQQLNLSRDA